MSDSDRLSDSMSELRLVLHDVHWLMMRINERRQRVVWAFFSPCFLSQKLLI